MDQIRVQDAQAENRLFSDLVVELPNTPKKHEQNANMEVYCRKIQGNAMEGFHKFPERSGTIKAKRTYAETGFFQKS
jgi:hypothetical protein